MGWKEELSLMCAQRFESIGAEQIPKSRFVALSLERCLGQEVTTDSRAQAVICEYCRLGSTQL